MVRIRLILLFMGIFCIPSIAVAIDNLYCYWPMDGDVMDASNSPTGISGTLFGSASFVPGQIGQAIHFDETDVQYIGPARIRSVDRRRRQGGLGTGGRKSAGFDPARCHDAANGWV